MPKLVEFKIVPKDFFFDPAAILKGFERGRRVALAKIGAFIMTGARSLTSRRSRKSASPGQPPRRHGGQIHDNIFFAGDSAWETVAIGPLVFNKSGDNVDVPGLLELGGTAMRRPYFRGRRQQVTYHKFPFMGPSLKEAEENDKLSEAWKDVIKP
jgi:hypothetical protein